MIDMANKQNLKVPTSSEARRNGKKGGINSGKARREKRDLKKLMADLKLVYAADTKEKAETELDHLEDKWGELYPIVIKSWRDKWEMLSCYFSTPRLSVR